MNGANENSLFFAPRYDRDNWVLRNSKYVIGGLIIVLLACLCVSIYYQNQIQDQKLNNNDDDESARQGQHAKLSQDDPPKDLATVLTENGLEKYVDALTKEGVTLEDFRTLNAGDLRGMGITSKPAIKELVHLITILNLVHDD